ncbi:MAG TPA: ATP-binding protein, partial [Aggregatilineales bacterium]|nr:ATP-binding protein [Aggregatilineales bacterium]
AELVPRLMDTKPDRAKVYILELEHLTRTAMAEMRTLLMELRPDALVRTELGVLLWQLCDTLKGNVPVKVNLNATELLILPEKSQIVFYRIAQESLNNIAKHAHATEVNVELSKTDNRVELCISDNGRGFSHDEIPPDHYGLKFMQERASSVGAELTIKSTKGTQIILSQIIV